MGKKAPARGGAQGKRRRAAPDPTSESSEEDDVGVTPARTTKAEVGGKRWG